MAFKEYTGEILPLDTPAKTFAPYEGDILPLEREVQSRGIVGSALDAFRAPPGQPGVMNKIADTIGKATLPLATAIGGVKDYFTGGDPMEPGYNPATSIAGGLMNAPKEALTTGLAVNETIDRMSDPHDLSVDLLPDNAAAIVDQTMPEYKTSGTMDALTTEVAQAGVGGAIGAKAMVKTLKNLPRAIKWAAGVLAAEGGAVATVDQDATGVLFGEKENPEDILPVWGGIALDENGDYNEELVKKRLNQLADAFIIAKGGEKIAKTGAAVGKFMVDVIGTPIDTFLRKSPKEQAIVREMADTIQGWHDNMTPEEQFHWRMKMADQIEQHSRIKAETGVEGIDDVDIRRDTMTAAEKALPQPPAGDKQAYRDYVAQKAKLNSLRTGQKGKGSSELEAATGMPARELEGLNTQTEIVFGGDEGVEAAREGIQETGFKQVDAEKELVDRVDTKLTDAKKGVDSLIEGDETFGQLPREGDVKLDVDEQTRRVADRTVDEIDIEGVERTKQKNLLYGAIPDDARVGTASLNDAIEKALPALDDTMRAKLGSLGDNFKKLDEFANFELQDAITKAADAGEFQKAKLLRGLKKNINEEQLDYLAASGDGPARDAAQRARDYYKNEYAPYFREGVGEEIQDISRAKKMNKPGEYRRDTRTALGKTITDPNAEELTGKVYDLLEKKGNGKLLGDYAIGRVATKAQKIINKNGKLTAAEIDELGAELDTFAPVFKKAGQTERLEAFRTKLRDKNMSVEELSKNLEEVKKTAKVVEEQVLGEDLKDFFQRSGTGFKAAEDGYTIFNKIMDDPQRVSELEGLARRAGSEGGLAKDGMKAAFGRWSKEKFFKAGRDAGGAPLVNEQVYGKNFEHMMKVGKAILGDEHAPLLEVQKLLMKEAGEMSLSETQRAFRLGDVGAQDKGMRDATATIITFAFGTLDRMGARIRAASGRAITKLSKSDQAREIMDIMYANPDEFVRVLRDVAARDRHTLSKVDKDALYAMGFKGAVFADDDSNENPNNKLNTSSRKSFEQTDRVLGEQ